MKHHFGKRAAALVLALLIILPALPLSAAAANPALNVTPAPGFTVYRFDGATADARSGVPVPGNVIDLSQTVYFLTGNDVQMSGLCLWPVEGDELPPATICNSGYKDKVYSSDLLSLFQVSSSSLMAGTILGKDVGYDWDTGKFYANGGYALRYMAAGEMYPEPGTYRFLMFYSNSVYYSDVYTITDDNNLCANQGVADVVWVVDDHPASTVPYNVDESKASFGLSILLPADVMGISSVRLLKADYDMFGSDSYIWSGVNSPGDSFRVGSYKDEGVFEEGHCFSLEDCEISNMSRGSYRVKVIAGDGRVFIDNSVVVVKEVSADPPVITTASLPSGKVDEPYSATVEATPVSGGAITWTLSGKLPDGLTFGSDGTISGTPTKEGVYSFAIRANEEGAGFAEKDYSITVAEPDLKIVGDGYFWYNSVGEQIKFGSTYTVSMSFNRSPHAGETASASVYYTTVDGAERRLDHTLTMYSWGGMNESNRLPEDAARVDRVEFYLNGERVFVRTLGASVAPAFELKVTGSSGQSLYADIYNESGEFVRSQYVGYSGGTFNFDSLPSGTYRIMLSGNLYGFGRQNYGETTVTLRDGVKERVTLPVVPHYATNITLDSTAEGSRYCYATYEWYADPEGTVLLQTGSSRTLLDDEAVYVRALPKYSTTETNLPTGLTRVDRGGSTTGFGKVTLTLPKKPTVTARLSALCEQVDGSAPARGYYSVSVTIYGEPGYSNNYYYSPNWREGEALTLDYLTEGTKIVFTGATGWGSYIYFVTAEDVARGTLELNPTVPLADGLIRWNATYTDSTGTYPYNNYVYNMRLLKEDGTELPFIRRDEFLVLSDPSAVAFGEKLTLSVWRGDEEYPDSAGAGVFTVTNDAGRRSGSVVVPMVQRPSLSVDVSRGLELQDVTLLLFGADGNLVWQKRDAEGSSLNTRFRLSTPRLAAGAYYLGIGPTSYLDGLDPEAYDTAAELIALPYSAVTSAVTDPFDHTYIGELTLPEGFRGAQMINLGLSGVRMSKEVGEQFRLDVTVTPKAGFTWGNGRYDDVEIYAVTNQKQNSTGEGYISTRSLSVNGVPIEINRWGEQNGIIQGNGTITLRLTKAQVEELGGFPLKLSTTCIQSNAEKLEATAYLRYHDALGAYRSDYVGQFSESTDALTLTAPGTISDGQFYIYGRGPASLSGDPYTVTLYLGGEPVGSGVTDNRRGYYHIAVNLDESRLRPLQELRFAVSGAFAGGARAYNSEEQVSLYNPEGAQVQTFTLNWESHLGDFEAGRGQSIIILNDGAAPNLYKSWYRGANRYTEAGKVFWTVTFSGHPEKVEGARVYVPRNGKTECLECVRQSDGSWASEPTFFYGAAPDGAWVEFDCPVEYGYVSDPESAFSDGDVAEFLNLLSGSDSFTGAEGNPLNGDVLTFLIGDSESGHLPVGFSLWKEEWNEEELERFRALEDGAATPNLLSYSEGYMTFGEGEDAFTVWATDTVYRYVDHDDNSKHLYEETIYTPDFRMVSSWDEAARTKQVSILAIGGLGYVDPDVGETEDETLREFARTAAVQTIWLTFYQEFAYALADAITAEPGEANQTSGGISNVAVSRVSARRGPSPQEIIDGVKRLEKMKEKTEKFLDNPAIKFTTESFNWCHGREISSYDIRKIKDFLDDNPCLKRLYKFYRSGTDDANNPYRVIAEADAVYYKIGMGELGKIVENSFNAGSYLQGSAKEAAKKVGDAMYKGAVETLNDSWYKLMWEADVFSNQSENLAHDIYLAAKRAEREETGIGGLCSEGINWSRFPTRLYDYNRYFGYGPRSYLRVSPPPGPQGRYDPSGYVYEAVPSNRVEGAEVTLWQLDEPTVETDGEGQVAYLSGGALFSVDAELFGIEPNPQTTGADGRYQWFVPTGWWRVTVSKAGYEVGDTGVDGKFGVGAAYNATDGKWYMPVLPEQLDVNIPLVSYESPEVSKIVANTKGLFVVFSKYMDESTLSSDRFELLVNGRSADFALSFVDSEKSGPSDGAPSYTRTVKLTYPGMAENDSVSLVIDNRVESYAGVAMESRCESGILTVAAPGTAETPTASVPSGEVEENTAVVIVPPTEGTVVRYTLDGSDPTEDSPILTDAIIITEETTVKAIATGALVASSGVLSVRYTTPSPISAPERVTAEVDGKPVSDGDTVEPGKLTLVCATEGAEIWYTTNGVCPCDDETARNLYTGPVDLLPGTYYFRVRALKDGVWSEGLPLHLTVKAPFTNPFVDVKETEYYHDPVLWAVSHDPQITKGVSADRFAPDETCTRAQVVTFLWRASGQPEPTAASNPFSDVKPDDYFCKAVLWAVEKGITKGTDKTHFSPDEGCTRGQVVTFLWRAKGSPAPAGSSNPFRDVKSDDYFFSAVLWAVENRVTAGTGAKTFSPGDTCTRGQIVTFLYRDMA
ncbi:MAG: S-layer homology domain-containing protein [Clostridia bacterium]|nr:S-layer homology domain-containing protein [Clostridia bacterium]